MYIRLRAAMRVSLKKMRQKIVGSNNQSVNDHRLLVWRVEELLADVDDCRCECLGRPGWVLNRLSFAPGTIRAEDLDQMRSVLSRVPSVDQLTECRLLVP